MSITCAKKDSFDTRVKTLPHFFRFGQNEYLISDTEPGIIEDAFIAYTADAGARTIDYKTQKLVRHLYAGALLNFRDLPTSEQSELLDTAKGALALLSRIEKERGLSEPKSKIERS